MNARKIIIITIILILIQNVAYAKYLYNFEKTIVKLKRDSDSPICQLLYSTEEMTNENVIITIKANEEIEQASGFELSEDKKILTKEVYENEEGKITVRDMSGNYTDIEYEVNNIDKESPQIIGCENGGEYKSPLNLEYSDNVEVEEVCIDQYSEELKISFYENYIDSYLYKGIDRTNKTITINVDKSPRNTKKYKYYINGKLNTVIPDTKYTFTGLEKGKKYEIKVEAIDENGDILDTKKMYAKTSFYKSIVVNKLGGEFNVTFEKIDQDVSKINYAVWNCNDEKNVKWFDTQIEEGEAKVKCSSQNNEFYQAYNIHVYFYDEGNNIIDVIAFLVDFGTNYQEKNSEININQITESGNYTISVKDTAGNKIIYDIKVK